MLLMQIACQVQVGTDVANARGVPEEGRQKKEGEGETEEDERKDEPPIGQVSKGVGRYSDNFDQNERSIVF